MAEEEAVRKSRRFTHMGRRLPVPRGLPHSCVYVPARVSARPAFSFFFPWQRATLFLTGNLYVRRGAPHGDSPPDQATAAATGAGHRRMARRYFRFWREQCAVFVWWRTFPTGKRL